MASKKKKLPKIAEPIPQYRENVPKRIATNKTSGELRENVQKPTPFEKPSGELREIKGDIMKIALTIVSILVLIGCFLFLMEKQESIPLPVQIGVSLLMIGYEILLFKKIYKE